MLIVERLTKREPDMIAHKKQEPEYDPEATDEDSSSDSSSEEKPKENTEDERTHIKTTVGKAKVDLIVGKDGYVLQVAIAVFVIVSSLGILASCIAYLLDAIGRNFFHSAGLVIWVITSFISAYWSHWPRVP